MKTILTAFFILWGILGILMTGKTLGHGNILTPLLGSQDAFLVLFTWAIAGMTLMMVAWWGVIKPSAWFNRNIEALDAFDHGLSQGMREAEAESYRARASEVREKNYLWSAVTALGIWSMFR